LIGKTKYQTIREFNLIKIGLMYSEKKAEFIQNPQYEKEKSKATNRFRNNGTGTNLSRMYRRIE
jgi:hypothetical protein